MIALVLTTILAQVAYIPELEYPRGKKEPVGSDPPPPELFVVGATATLPVEPDDGAAGGGSCGL